MSLRRFAAAVLVTLVSVAIGYAQGPGGRLYFDKAGNGGDQTAPHPGATAKEDPVLPGAGPHRLYIYWEFGGANQKVLSPNFDVEVDGGTINRAYYYNGLINSLKRWNTTSPNPPVDNPGSSVEFKSGSIDHNPLGGFQNNDDAHMYDRQYSRPDNSTIAGYVDVSSPAQNASVWFRVGALGIAIQGGTPDTPIRFGFGDAAVRAGSRDRSALADATIIPEPASLLLLLVGPSGLVLRRRG